MASVTYDELKTKYQNKPALNDEVKCSVLAKLKDGYLVNVNDEWEGFVPNGHVLGELEDDTSSPQALSVLVISGPDRSDRYVVSPTALKEKSVWGDLKKHKEEKKIFTVKLARAIKGGAEVFIDGVRAFLPGRYIRLPGVSPNNWAEQEVDVLVEELNYDEKKLILNQRGAWEQSRQKQAIVTMQSLKEGDILEVPVIRTADFGVFVDLGGLDGLIPASELSWGRFNHPKDVVKIGQKLRARVFRIEKDNKRVALSVKQLLGDPWEDTNLDWHVGKQLTGKVIGKANFGFFVELKPGIEALLHNSEIPEDGEPLKEGTLIEARIIKIDPDQKRIGLSLRKVNGETTETKIETTSQEEQQTPAVTETASEPTSVQTENVQTSEEQKTPDIEEQQTPAVTETASEPTSVQTEDVQTSEEQETPDTEEQQTPEIQNHEAVDPQTSENLVSASTSASSDSNSEEKNNEEKDNGG